MRRARFGLLLVFILLALSRQSSAGARAPLDVRALGAKGDGISRDTSAIQAAIDKASAQGGGEVLLSAGRYLCGTLHLCSGLTLRLESGATLIASPDTADFDPLEKLPYDSHADRETTDFQFALLAGRGIHDAAIVGEGIIDGNRTRRGGPKPIALKQCERITIRGIKLRNAPNYSISFLGCDDIVVDGVTIRHGFADGIDPDCSRDVRIANCSVESSDDAICLKTSLALGERRSTENVTVSNCVLSSSSNNFKMGTESSGDFRNIAVSNCVMFRRSGERDSSGIAIESVDGAIVDGVTVSNITMRDVHNPLFIRLGNRGRGLNPPVPGALRNVSVSHIVATGADMTCSITGLPGYPVREVTLSDLRITMTGGGKAANLEVPELPARYPECNMFGALPAYALYCRHVQAIRVRGASIGWEQPDDRPAVVMDDATDCAPTGLSAESQSGPIMWLRDVHNTVIQGCGTANPAPLFLRLSGRKTDSVKIIGCDLSRVAQIAEFTDGARPAALRQSSNVTGK